MNATTRAQTITALPPGEDGKRLTPVADPGEVNVSDLKHSEEFKAFLNRIADFATAQSNSPIQWERRRKTIKLRKHVLGEYYGIFDKQQGWVSGKEEGDGIYYDPQTATFIDSIVAQLVKTRPIKKCTPRNPELIEKREAARVAERLLELDDLNDASPKRQQREWKWNIICAGESYRITYFNQAKAGCGVLEDVFEPKLIEGGDKAKYCPLCSTAIADETGKCAQCGNPQMDEFEAIGTTITVQKGKKYKQIGDVDYDVPDALEMTVIGETDSIGEALIVMRDRLIPRCVLEDALNEHGLPTTDVPDILHYKQMFEHTRSEANTPEFELLHYQEFWVAPAVYTSFVFAQDTPLTGGQTIPKGSKAKELVPHGFYFSRVETRITTFFPQAMSECLSHTVNTIGEGFHGHGEWDLSELQDQATEAKSMKMNSMLLDSTQPLLVRNGYVDLNNFENKYGVIVPVDEYPLERGLDDLMTRVRPGMPPSEAYQLGQEIKGEMQQRIGAFSTQSDAPDIKAMGTATGIAAITEQTLGRRAPALQLYSQMEVDQAYQKLELRQKYWCRKMYDSAASELSDDAIKWFCQANIRQDIAISVVQDSWMPRTDAQKQTNLQSYLAVVGQIVAAKGDPKMLDEVLRKANEVFGAGFDFGDTLHESTEAQLRLEKLQEVGAFVEQTFGPMAYDATGAVSQEAMMLAYAQTTELLRLTHSKTGNDERDIFGSLPLDVMFDTHSEFEEVYTDWLRTAEGRAASVFTRALVHKLAEYHIQAEAYRTTRLTELRQLTQTPELNQQLVVNEAMHNQTLDQNEDIARQQLEHQAANQVVQQAMMPPAAQQPQ